MRNFVWTLASVVLMGCLAAAAWSSEADELREKARALQQQAEQAAKNGCREEAEKLIREAQELHQAAQKHERKQPDHLSNREIDELHGRLKALAQKEQPRRESKSEVALAELRKHRATIERELAELRGRQEQKVGPRHPGKHPPELPHPVQETGLRIKHIRVAVDNLNAAGLHDIAEQLAHKADAMECEHHRAHGEFQKEQPSPERRKHFEPDE